MDADQDYLRLNEHCSNIEEVLKISSCKELRLCHAISRILAEIEEK
jgi:hypothetical protein